jgi:SAM-dependent methyltransferase
MSEKHKCVLHSMPVERENNLLDYFSDKHRLGYYASSFLASEKALVENKIHKVFPSGRVLNVGCGNQGTERTLFPTGAYEIYGIDIDEASLRMLQQRKLYDGLFRSSITSLPVVSDSFDIVYLRLVLHHLVYPKNLLGDALRECFRVLKPGGILALVEPNSWHPIGALMNLAHSLRLDLYIHGTDDDLALSPRVLRKQLSIYGSDLSTQVVTYSWRRLPIPVQSLCNSAHRMLGKLSDHVPYFGHTLMMISVKS